MSENWLQIIPSSPDYVPTASQRGAALALMRELAPGAEDIMAVLTDDIAFIDAGANFTDVRCPRCGTTLDITGWWQSEVSRCSDDGSFSRLATVTPCCNKETTLNDLVYVWPQGFSRWRVRVTGPGRSVLEPNELDALAAAVGHEIREIWTHI